MKQNNQIVLAPLQLEELTIADCVSIDGGNIFYDAGAWIGEKVGAAAKFVASLDWTGSFAG